MVGRVPDSGSKNGEKSFSKVSREKRGTISRRYQESAERPRGIVWMKKVIKLWWHIVLIDTLNTETSSCVLNPVLYRKPLDCPLQ